MSFGSLACTLLLYSFEWREGGGRLAAGRLAFSRTLGRARWGAVRSLGRKILSFVVEIGASGSTY